MRVVITAIGSAGDVHPFVAIGRALRERGHDVVILASAWFEEAVTRAGVGFEPMDTREHYVEAVHTDFVAFQKEIQADYAEGDVLPVTLHDGSQVRLRKIDKNYDPTDRSEAFAYLQQKMKEKEFLTGLLYVEPSQSDSHDANDTVATPLNQVPYEQLTPGSKGLEKILSRHR